MKRKVGRTSPFSEIQQTIIQGQFSAWENFLVTQHLQFGKDSRRREPESVKAWTMNAAQGILARPEFKNLDMSVKDANGWKTVSWLVHSVVYH